MNTTIEPKTGKLILLVGPHSLNSTMLNAIARLGEASAAQAAETANGGFDDSCHLPADGGLRPPRPVMPPWPAVRVLDGGNRFDAYAVARAVRGRPEVLNRITVSRAFT